MATKVDSSRVIILLRKVKHFLEQMESTQETQLLLLRMEECLILAGQMHGKLPDKEPEPVQKPAPGEEPSFYHCPDVNEGEPQ